MVLVSLDVELATTRLDVHLDFHKPLSTKKGDP